jgi:molecular chaperone DnaK
MERATLDFGIDLGTTNSAIGVMRGVGTEVIKNNDDADITPSAVSIDKRGTVLVGARAKIKDVDSYMEFKRRMGTDYQYQFKACGLTKRPEELSAEVLKELRGNVQQRLGEVIDAAVITVPAAFELHQCDATRKAAQLAGLVQSPFIQEPIAAALAYGFQVDTVKSYWLVYDFGGGTFDAALIKAEDGTIRVINHGGDNYLGGSDVDWAIVDHLLVPRILAEHRLESFERTSSRWKTAFAKLKRSAERAKIDLSRRDRTNIDGSECQFDDGSGNTIEVDFEVTRAAISKVAGPFIRRSIDICQRVLKERNLAKGAVEKLILVGGPTLAPYFRESLTSELGIEVDYTVDPLTVVARGAAIFAGTQQHPRTATASNDTFALNLKYNPVGLDANPLVAGEIKPPKGRSLAGFTIELADRKTRWRSGKVAVGTDGVFTATLRAEPGDRNVYSIELCDSTGQQQKTSPDVLTYTIGAAVGEQVLTHDIGVALANNEYDRVFEKGHTLPAKATRPYHAASGLKKGESGDFLVIPVTEGESDHADRNKLVGRLEIGGQDISRDLPIGSEIEVTIRVDESRIVTVQAYVPVLDKDFEVKCQMGATIRGATEIRADLEREVARITELRHKAAMTGDQQAAKLIASVETGQSLQEIKDLAADARDVDAAGKCENRLLELKNKVDQIADTLEWPGLVAQTHEFCARFSKVLKDGSADQQKEGQAIIAALQRIIQERNSEDLRRKQAQAESLYWRILFVQPAYWVYCFQQLEKEADHLSDPERAARLLDQGRAYLSHNNETGLRNVVTELWKLLPEERAEEFKRGYGSGLRRAG